MASVVPWPFLCSSSPTPAGSNNRSFAQAVTNSCKVQQNQLPKPAIKGDSLCIKISQGEYEKGFEDCQHNLRGRLFLSKGDKPISASNLHEKLLALWKPTGNWKIIPLGKGFFDFEFSSMEDLKKIWAAGSWNLKPGILRLSKWSSDFSIRNHNQTHVQVWIRLIDLPQEYWRHTTLFEIANGIGTPITLDNATKNRTFGHFARILVDLDLSKRIFNEIMVEREGFSFYVEIQYERLPDYCNNCATIGHSIGQCKWLHNNYNASNEVVKKQKENAHKGEASDIVKHPIPQEAGKHEVGKTKSSGGSKIIIEEDPLIIDIIRSREMTTTIHVEDAIKFVEETSSISVETLPVHIVQVEDTLALTETRNGNQQSNSFADMRITGPWCDAVTDMDYGNDHNLDNFEQELGTNNSIVGTDLNLSNFSANVIHDMQVLGLVPTVAQQTMDFLSDSWTNMGQKEDQPFQLVVPRKKKSKKKQPEASKGFKVGSSSRSHY